MKKLTTLFLLLFLQTSYAQTLKNVNAGEFKKQMRSPNAILVDLRTEEEIAKKGKIQGAVEIDWFGKNAEAEILKLDKSKTYLVYCAGGGRSLQCGELMEKAGFKEVYNLEKGFDDWKKNGFDVENKK
jgi:phage shock protein E